MPTKSKVDAFIRKASGKKLFKFSRFTIFALL